jgi:hypothetical protein
VFRKNEKEKTFLDLKLIKEGISKLFISVLFLLYFMKTYFFITLLLFIIACSTTNVPIISYIEEIPEGFEVVERQVHETNQVKQIKLTLQNQEFKEISNQYIPLNAEFISSKYIYYYNNSFFELQKQLIENPQIPQNQLLYQNYSQIGQANYIYEITKPQFESYIIGIVFYRGNYIIAISDSGINKDLLFKRIIEISKKIDKKI